MRYESSWSCGREGNRSQPLFSIRSNLVRDFVSQRKKNTSRVSLHQTIEKVMCHASYDVPFSYMRTLFISWRSLNLQSLFSEDCSKSRFLWGGKRTTRRKAPCDRPKLSASTIAEVAWQVKGVPWRNINIIHSSSCSQIRRKPVFFFSWASCVSRLDFGFVGGLDWRQARRIAITFLSPVCQKLRKRSSKE